MDILNAKNADDLHCIDRKTLFVQKAYLKKSLVHLQDIHCGRKVVLFFILINTTYWFLSIAEVHFFCNLKTVKCYHLLLPKI